MRQRATDVDEARRAQEQVILLHLAGMNDAKIAADGRVYLSLLERSVLVLGQIGHGTLELGDDGTRGKVTSGKDTELGLAGIEGVARGVRDLYAARRMVEFEVASGMSANRSQYREGK